MERTSGAIKKNIYNRSLIKAVSLFVLNLLLFSGLAAQTTDYLLIAYPAEAVIYDGFQKKLSGAKKESFTRGTPFRILRKDGYFNDGFTRYIYVEYGGNNYYIQKDEKGRIINSQACLPEFLSGISISRKLTVTDKEKITLNPWPEGQRKVLESGKEIKVIFRYMNKYYIQEISEKNGFGWAQLSSKFLKKSAETGSGILRSPQIKDDLKNIVNEQNKLFGHFKQLLDSLSGEEKEIPVYRLRFEDYRITIFSGNQEVEKKFRSGFSILENKIRTKLAGTGLKVETIKGQIVITE